MRSVARKPMRQSVQLPTSPKRMLHPAREISSGVAPLAYAAATMEPALTPVMQ